MSNFVYVFIEKLLVREPFPDPNSRRPINITGNIADVPLKNIPTANVDDPSTQRNENRNNPTERESINFVVTIIIIHVPIKILYY